MGPRTGIVCLSLKLVAMSTGHATMALMTYLESVDSQMASMSTETQARFTLLEPRNKNSVNVVTRYVDNTSKPSSSSIVRSLEKDMPILSDDDFFT